jgi:aspartyl-tRNA(Asn)/glutamyl-tRNA(Gln) amidotransferase subunit B
MSEELRTPTQPPAPSRAQAGGSIKDILYEPVIGLEIHVQLATATKMFCGCALSFGEPPNTRTCPVCLGLPGSLPVVNARAVHFGLMIGLALGSQLAPRSIFHRKNYFYPDLPKGYQISQYDEPLCLGGHHGDVRIHRVHLEEDAAKLTHVGASGRIHGSDASIVDFNRGGTPLAEIVTEPDVRSAEQASEWLKLLRVTLRQLGVSDVNMEEGSLRCDANISLRPAGRDELGVKTELKNMNSFRFIERGIKAEISRQEKILRGGGHVVQETLHFDPGSGAITSLRSKEEAHDYRYFPEPDLLPVVINQQMLDAARADIVELPAERAARFESQLGLSAESAQLLAFRAELGDYFQAALDAAASASSAASSPEGGGVGDAPPAQALANWVTGELAPRLGDAGEDDADAGSSSDPAASRVQPSALAELVGLVAAKRVSVGAARQVLDKLVADGGDPLAIVEAEGLAAIDGDDELAGIVAAALAANADAAQRVREGNAKAIGPIVGHVMRETKGRADGTEVARLVHEQLGV